MNSPDRQNVTWKIEVIHFSRKMERQINYERQRCWCSNKSGWTNKNHWKLLQGDLQESGDNLLKCYRTFTGLHLEYCIWVKFPYLLKELLLIEMSAAQVFYTNSGNAGFVLWTKIKYVLKLEWYVISLKSAKFLGCMIIPPGHGFMGSQTRFKGLDRGGVD